MAQLKSSVTCVIQTKNRGVAAARNLGIRPTSSPYIVLLDADDILEPNYFEKATRILDKHQDLDFVTCAIKAFEGASYTWSPPPCTLVDTLNRGGPHISTERAECRRNHRNGSYTMDLATRYGVIEGINE